MPGAWSQRSPDLHKAIMHIKLYGLWHGQALDKQSLQSTHSQTTRKLRPGPPNMRPDSSSRVTVPSGSSGWRNHSRLLRLLPSELLNEAGSNISTLLMHMQILNSLIPFSNAIPLFSYYCIYFIQTVFLNHGCTSTVVVQPLSHVQLFVTPWTPVVRLSPLSSTISQSLFKFMFIESVTLSISSSAAPFPFCLLSFPASEDLLKNLDALVPPQTD